MEKHMREICKKPESLEYKALLIAHIFWLIYDYIFHCNRANIFKHLYLSPKHYNDRYLKISMEHNISGRTLERYRKLFVLSFEIALMLLETNSITMKVA